MIYKEEHCLKRGQLTKKSIILCEVKTNRTKEKAGKSTITVENFNTLLSLINRTSSKCIKSQQVYRKIAILINKVDITDIYRTLHPTTEFTFFPGTCGTFTNVDHILEHGTNLNKLKLKSYKYVFSSHHVIILEIGNKDNKKFSVYLEIRQPTSK